MAPRILRVPEEYPAIQVALDEARPGDLVSVAPGTYREAVEVRVPRVTLRGRDRSTVVLDGGDRRANGVLLAGDGDVVENLTVQRYTGNGILVSASYATASSAYGGPPASPATTAPAGAPGGRTLAGFRVSYVTAADNGLYGVYAFGATDGRIEHSYASGHPDSGFYVGQCQPCDTLIDDVTAERNAVGYLGTNAGGGLSLTRSTFRANRVGITPNSQRQELLAPQRTASIIGNLVEDNGSPAAPIVARGGFGVGILVGGGNANIIERNTVRGNLVAGVLLTDLDGFAPTGNRFVANKLSGNGTDLVFASVAGGVVPLAGNCFESNELTTQQPPALQQSAPCSGAATLAGTDGGRLQRPPDPPGPSYRDVPLPPPQPSMPDAGASPTVGGRGAVLDAATFGAPA